MPENLFNEITGVTLKREREAYTDMQTYIDTRMRLEKEHRHEREWIRSVWEFYFVPDRESHYSKAHEEQFLVSVMETESKPEISLVKRFRAGKYFGESSVPITAAQLRDMVLGEWEWMKEQTELLIQEFYQKIKLFSYKIGFMVESLREQYRLKEGREIVTIDCFVNSQVCEPLQGQKMLASPARIRVCQE